MTDKSEPITDENESSWILVDEMDEAMNDIECSVQNDTQSKEVTELNDTEITYPADEPDQTASDLNHIETVTDDANHDNADDETDYEHLRRILVNGSNIQSYDDLNDGSTTDGSISILSDHEINQTNSDLVRSVQPMQMWMRCTPIDMTICTKRSRDNRCEASTSRQTNFIENLLDNLERFNDYLSGIYLFHVLLLCITFSSVLVMCVVCVRCISCEIELKQLQKTLYQTQIDISELKRSIDHQNDKIETKLILANVQPIDQPINQPIDNEIKPSGINDDQNVRMVWIGDDLLPILESQNKKQLFTPECSEESLYSEYNRQFCEQSMDKIMHFDATQAADLKTDLNPTDSTFNIENASNERFEDFSFDYNKFERNDKKRKNTRDKINNKNQSNQKQFDEKKDHGKKHRKDKDNQKDFDKENKRKIDKQAKYNNDEKWNHKVKYEIMPQKTERKRDIKNADYHNEF